MNANAEHSEAGDDDKADEDKGELGEVFEDEAEVRLEENE